MKALKWLAGIAIVIVLIAIIVHLRRDSIARDIANSILENQGFVVADLAVESMSTGRLELELLVIESESGARYEIRGLSVPLRDAGDETTLVSADSLAISYSTARDRQTMLSKTLETVFELQVSQGDLDIRVGSISLPRLPEIRDAALQAGVQGLSLAFSVNDIGIAAALAQGQLDGSRLKVGAIDGGDTVLSLDIEFVREDDRYNASGEVSAKLAAWLPTLQGLNLVPAGLQHLDVNLEGDLNIWFDQKTAGHAVTNLELAVADGSAVTYVVDGGRASSFVTSSADSFLVDFDYPANDWTLRTGNVQGVFNTDGLSATPVAVTALNCETGIVCTLNAAVDSQAISWNQYTVEAGTFTLPMTVSTGDITRVRIGAEARGEFARLQSEGIDADLVTVTGFSGTEIVVDDGSWRCKVDELQLAFDNFAASEDLLVSPGVFLQELNISDSGATLDGRIEISAPFDGTWKDSALSLPGAAGTFQFSNEELQASVDIVDLNDAVAGSLEWTRNAAANTGALRVTDGWASFDRARLSDYAPGRPLPFDVLQGSWDIDLQLQWQSSSGIPQYRGAATMTLDGIGGTYTDIAMVGLATDLTVSIDPGEGLSLQTAPVSIRLVDVGVPIEDIAFEYSADLDAQSVAISGLSVAVFGGVVSADPFEYSFTAESNAVLLHARDIQLQLMVDILEFESLAMTGSISGEIPVTMTDDKITVSNGQMRNDSAGMIRYQPPAGAVAAATSLGTITQTLTNFEFETLSSTINYTEGGDMQLLMRIVGLNPDIDPDQPYAFNLNLENNIPQMLRSLRAVRSIEDILKQRTEN